MNRHGMEVKQKGARGVNKGMYCIRHLYDQYLQPMRDTLRKAIEMHEARHIGRLMHELEGLVPAQNPLTSSTVCFLVPLSETFNNEYESKDSSRD